MRVSQLYFRYERSLAQFLVRNVSLGRFGSFNSSHLIGQPYGLSYEIVDSELRVLPPKLLQEVGMLATNLVWSPALKL